MTENQHKLEYKLISRNTNEIKADGISKNIEVKDPMEFSKQLNKFLEQYED